MGHALTTLESLGHILTRFSGATTILLGDIVLPLEFGLVVLNVKLLIVMDTSPYNTIIGQTWIHKMKVILHLSSYG